MYPLKRFLFDNEKNGHTSVAICHLEKEDIPNKNSSCCLDGTNKQVNTQTGKQFTFNYLSRKTEEKEQSRFSLLVNKVNGQQLAMPGEKKLIDDC